MRCQILDIAKCNLHISRMHEWISFFVAPTIDHKINPSSKSVFIVLFSLQFNSFILFHSTQNISFCNYMGRNVCLKVCVCMSYENLCQIIVNGDVLYMDVYLYCVSIVFCLCWKNQRIRLNHGAVAWIHVETLTTAMKKNRNANIKICTHSVAYLLAHAHMYTEIDLDMRCKQALFNSVPG